MSKELTRKQRVLITDYIVANRNNQKISDYDLANGLCSALGDI